MSVVVSFSLKPHVFDSMQSIQNLGLAVISMVSGEILDEKGYFMLEIFFAACVCSKFACVAGCSTEKKRNKKIERDGIMTVGC